MVDLQDAANLAVVLGLIASLGFNVYQFLYGPWARRREEIRQNLANLGTEIESAKVAASQPRMSAYMGRLETWQKKRHRLPKRIRREVDLFYELSQSYWDAYLLASRIVELCILKSLSNRPEIPRLPKMEGGQNVTWIVRGPSKSRMSKSSLEDALVEVLTEPLLQGEKVRWTWLEDNEDEFARQLGKVVDAASFNRLLEDVENKIGFEAKIVGRPREIKAAIRDYRFRYLRLR